MFLSTQLGGREEIAFSSPSFLLCLRFFSSRFFLFQAGAFKKAHPVIPPFDFSLALSSLLSLASTSAIVLHRRARHPPGLSRRTSECENEMEVPRMRNVFVNSLLMR